jgi:hypothetical protein
MVKGLTKNPFIMKQKLHISAAFDQPAFIQKMVEQLATRRYELGFSKQIMPVGFKALETSATETYVSGTMAIDFNNIEPQINMPFITCFLFTCIKGKSDPYHLIWSSSLS